MNHYETVFIATPVLSDVQVKEAVSKFRGVITENGGQIISEEDWGLRKLAYPIQKKTTGFYYLMEFTGEGDIIEKLETQYRRDERVIRFLTFKWTSTPLSTPKNAETKTPLNKSKSHGTESIRDQIPESSHRRGQKEKILPLQKSRYQVCRLQGR